MGKVRVQYQYSGVLEVEGEDAQKIIQSMKGKEGIQDIEYSILGSKGFPLDEFSKLQFAFKAYSAL